MALSGSVALVTGGGQGLGAEIAKSLASAGSLLALCGRRIERLETVAKEVQPKAIVVACDVTQEDQVQETVEQVVKHYGKLDILVNNAGIAAWVPFEETTTKLFDDIIATNLRGSFLFAKYAWPHLKSSKGQILNISSIAGTQVFDEMTAYCASKHGLNGLSGVLAIEGARHGIRVQSLCPGSVATDIWPADVSSETKDRMMTAEQVAAWALALLASPRNLLIKQVVVENLVSPFQA